MPTLDEVSAGERISAEQWNFIVNLLRRKITGPDVVEHTTGWHIARPPPTSVVVKQFATVVLTVLPVAEDTSLTARRVRYIDEPPEVGRYEWDDTDFETFPDFGADILDYEAFYWSPDDDGDPTIDTPFIFARLERSDWLLSLDQRMERLVVARQFEMDDAQSRFILVQEIAPTRGTPWDGMFRKVGTIKTINVWPTLVAGDFTPFLWTPDDLADEMTVLPLTWWRGAWWLKQRPKWAVSERKGLLKVLDCTGVEEPAP